MSPEEYSVLALRTNHDMGYERNLVHAVLLITSESGEVAGEVKNFFAHGADVDTSALVGELGDLCWGINLLLVTLGLTWQIVFKANIAKLEVRFPEDCYGQGWVMNRDKEAEAEALKAEVAPYQNVPLSLPTDDSCCSIAAQLAAQAWCRPETHRIPMDTRLCKAFEEILDTVIRNPWLSNATTESLLEELSSRSRVEGYANHTATRHHV